MVSALEIQRLSKRFGGFEAVREVSATIPPGTILSLLGPSGCGKTTILRMIAGLLRPTSGAIRFDGEDVTRVPPHRRRVGLVFQNYALFPHMTVAENVGFGLKMQNVARDHAKSLIEEVLSMVRMKEMKARLPAELSGGQQQRVALARAIVTRPRLLLLDEPFGALDRRLREEMQIEVKQLQRELGLTFIFVTHDQEEALTMSDQIAVMRAGRIEQIGAPAEVFERPKTKFVAEFFGALNTLPVMVLESGGHGSLVEALGRRWFVATEHRAGAHAIFAVRASDTHLAAGGPTNANAGSLPATIEEVIYKGAIVLCRVRLADGSSFTSTAKPESAGALAPSKAVTLNWLPGKSFLFPAVDGEPAEGQDVE